MTNREYSYTRLEEIFGNIYVSTPLERLRILTMIWMVRDVLCKENWEHPHAVLDYHPEIEAELGRFPGHNEVGKKGIAEWKNNFNTIRDSAVSIGHVGRSFIVASNSINLIPIVL